MAGPNNFLGQTEAKARYSLVQSLARIWLQQNRIHRSYLEELLDRARDEGRSLSLWGGEREKPRGGLGHSLIQRQCASVVADDHWLEMLLEVRQIPSMFKIVHWTNSN